MRAFSDSPFPAYLDAAAWITERSRDLFGKIDYSKKSKIKTGDSTEITPKKTGGIFRFSP